MKAYYNLIGIGDVLLVQFDKAFAPPYTYEQKGCVVRITDEQSRLAGYNLFNVSREGLDIAEQGLVDLDQYVLNQIKKILHKYGFDDHFEVDLSPKVVVGEVVHMKPHPNADRLQVCKVDVGNAQLQIVCGAPNVAENQRVVVAMIGAILPGGLEVKKTSLRGVDSYGMICSAKELGRENTSQQKGVLVLNSTYRIGSEFNI